MWSCQSAITAGSPILATLEIPGEQETFAKLLPGATSIHAWAPPTDDGRANLVAFRRYMTMARDAGFDGPIMLHGAYQMDNFAWAPDLWSGVDAMRDEVNDVFGEIGSGDNSQ